MQFLGRGNETAKLVQVHGASLAADYIQYLYNRTAIEGPRHLAVTCRGC
jgi:hypothetical protein